MTEIEPGLQRRNSTNDRTRFRVGILARALSLLSRLSSSLAAEAASRLFLHAPRAPRLRGDAKAFLKAGAEFSVGWGRSRLAAWSWGQGPTIVLAHGWGGRGAQMRTFVPALAGAGYRTVVFDGPAHGLSPGHSSSLPAFADAISAVVRATDARGVVGHSLGGAATLLALARGLSVSRAVVLGAPSNAERIWAGFVRALGLTDTAADGALRLLERRVGARFSELNVSSIASRIEAGILVVHDRDDAEIPWSEGEENARLLSGARLVTTHGLGHRLILRDPDVVETTVRFLAEGITPARCEACRRPLARARTAELCENCLLGRELFDREGRFAA